MAELERSFSNVDLTRTLRAAARATASEVEGEIRPYPDVTEANQPRTVFTPGGDNTWYQRGQGTKTILESGEVRLDATSEDLKSRWGIKLFGRLGATLGNLASYAERVHGAATQEAFHRARGWVTDRTALNRVVREGRANRIYETAINNFLQRIGLR